MTLAEQIDQYKKLHHNGKHTFKCGTKCEKLHDFLDSFYKDAVNEYKTTGTSERAKVLKNLTLF